MDCEVAREALSARLDGEREPVPSARVDEHLDECGACGLWFEQVAGQASRLQRLIESRPVIGAVDLAGIRPTPQPRERKRMSWQRWALLCVGIAQVAVGIVQGLGFSLGLGHHYVIGSGNHLLNESTAWTIALGVAMVVAAIWPGAAEGLAGVLMVFVAVLSVYVVVDALSGAVTTSRVLTHLPVLLGTVLAIMVWLSRGAPRPAPDVLADEPDIVLPQNASRGRRHGHLWPTDGSAA
ncbi:zf-HC2 domain-containing protein [Mycobacterium marinum]|uniref:zf-HC2 domain-containing protein n=1 Tax=Mycobacterium marinum TaxID=1781 RepID=UPI0023407635|nr:zf-HC2 domain-containing protein [Mycobacterium marinum]MDC8993977.1 zf-HC2 domain-containing protein [Mycobacterium marinum]WDZ14274.1 zf-HC2 domain-containing protein [Mycobacterium marinum]